MKISKTKITTNHLKKSCEMDMPRQVGTGLLPNGEIDHEGRMAKRQLEDIAEYSQQNCAKCCLMTTLN